MVDESTMSLDKFDATQAWLAKTSRHAGHASIFIGHSFTDISRSIREQCTQIFVLGCSRIDAKQLADIYDSNEILKCTRLDTFYFCRILSRGSKISFGRVDPNTKRIYSVKYDEKMEKELDEPEGKS